MLKSIKRSIPNILVFGSLILLSSCGPSLTGGAGGGSGGSSAYSVTVQAEYSIAPNWNNYYESASTTTACTGLEGGTGLPCLHGGDKKMVITKETSCTGLTATDHIGAFDWSCSVQGGFAVFTSQLDNLYGLGNLLQATGPAWAPNYVAIQKSGSTIAQSSSAVWWTNPVAAAPSSAGATINLPTAGTIYVITSSQSGKGYTLGANQQALVTLPGVVYTSTTNATYFISATSMQFLWVEGNYYAGATTASYGIYGSGVTYSTFHLLRISLFASYQFAFQYSANYNVVSNAVGAGGNGVYNLDSTSNYNRFYNLSGTDTSIGFSISVNSVGNVIEGLVVSNATIGVESDDANNTFVLVTAPNDSIGMAIDNSTTGNIVHNVLIGNTNSYGMGIDPSSTGTYSQIAMGSGTNQGLYIQAGGNNNVFAGNFLIGNSGTLCNINGTGNNITTTTCAPTSGFNLATTTLNLTNSFVGKVTTADSTNLTTGNPYVLYQNITDWVNFQNPMRSWGMDDGAAFPSNGDITLCASGDHCRIWDWSLSISDTYVRNTSDNGVSQNAAFVGGSACPSAVAGNDYITTEGGTNYLKNAVEIPLSGGNNDGLCESGETCLYTPNFGAYQGHGTLEPCTFTNGTITGVTMYGYSTNGR